MGAVHSLPGGAMARLYLESPLWDLLDRNVSLDRAKSILFLTNQHQPCMPLRGYISAWAQYRIAIAKS